MDGTRRRSIYPFLVRGARLACGHLVVVNVVGTLRACPFVFVGSSNFGILCQYIRLVVVVQVILGDVCFVDGTIFRDLSRVRVQFVHVRQPM